MIAYIPGVKEKLFLMKNTAFRCPNPPPASSPMPKLSSFSSTSDHTWASDKRSRTPIPFSFDKSTDSTSAAILRDVSRTAGWS